MSISVDEMGGALTAVQSINKNEREAATAYLQDNEQTPGYSLILLELAAMTEAPEAVRMGACVRAKNHIRKYWSHPDKRHFIPNDDRAALKSSIVSLCTNLEARYVEILVDAFGAMATAEYPVDWQDLPSQLVAALDTQDFGVISCVLTLMDGLTKRYRHKEVNDALIEDLQFTLNFLQEPLLGLYKATKDLVDGNSDNSEILTAGFAAISLMSEIFLSLNWHDLPPFFEDSIGEWAELFGYVLGLRLPLMAPGSNDDNPTPMIAAQTVVCECVSKLTIIAVDEIRETLPAFVTAIWELLMDVSGAAGGGTDILVATAITVLTSVASTAVHSHMFEDPDTLAAICERVVVPNIYARDQDEYNFEMDPTEYIRCDLEGADKATRRSAAAGLVNGLCESFLEPVTQIFLRYVEGMLESYAANPAENWREKDAAIYLTTALAVRASNFQEGITKVNELVDVVSFFAEHVHADLTPGANGGSTNAMLTADAVRFVRTWRNHLPTDALVSSLSSLIPLINHEQHVVATYAAATISDLVVAKRDGSAVVTGSDIEPFLEAILINLFGRLEAGESKEERENEYVMKAILRVVVVCQSGVGPYLETCIDKLKSFLADLCACPGNPGFSHHLFETIAALIGSVCTESPTKVEAFEDLLLGPFEEILTADVAEYMPYVFQILAQMLELRPTPIPEAYTSLLGPLVSAELWERTGNIPAMARLLAAFVTQAADEIVSGGVLEPLLGVFRKLVSSVLHDHHGFAIVNVLFGVLSPEVYGPYLDTMLKLLLTRYESSKTDKYACCLVVFTSVMMAQHGADHVIVAMEAIQAGLFAEFMTGIYLPHVQKVKALADRKICGLAMVKLVTATPRLLSDHQNVWIPILSALINHFEARREDFDDTALMRTYERDASMQYDTKFCKLVYAPRPVYDPFRGVDDCRAVLADGLSKLSMQQPGTFGPILQNNLDETTGGHLATYFDTYNMTLA